MIPAAAIRRISIFLNPILSYKKSYESCKYLDDLLHDDRYLDGYIAEYSEGYKLNVKKLTEYVESIQVTENKKIVIDYIRELFPEFLKGTS